MILLIPVVLLAALALVVFFLVKAFRVAWRGGGSSGADGGV